MNAIQMFAAELARRFDSPYYHPLSIRFEECQSRRVVAYVEYEKDRWECTEIRLRQADSGGS